MSVFRRTVHRTEGMWWKRKEVMQLEYICPSPWQLLFRHPHRISLLLLHVCSLASKKSAFKLGLLTLNLLAPTTVGIRINPWATNVTYIWSTTISAGERPAAARLLRSWVRIPPGAWIFICCECRVLSGRGLCDEVITRPEESYRLWCVVVYDLETSKRGAPYIYIYIYIYIYTYIYIYMTLVT